MRVRPGPPGAFPARLRLAPGHAVAPAVCAAPVAASRLLVASRLLAASALLAAAATAWLAFPPVPATAQSLRPFPPPFEIRVPVPPGPLVSGDTRYFVYELLITSFLPAPAQVSRVEVFAESAEGRRLLEYSGEELGSNMLPPFEQEDDPVVQRTIGPRSHGVVYVMLPLPASAATPRQFFHRVWFDLPAGDSTEADYVALETPIHDGSVIEVGRRSGADRGRCSTVPPTTPGTAACRSSSSDARRSRSGTRSTTCWSTPRVAPVRWRAATTTPIRATAPR